MEKVNYIITLTSLLIMFSCSSSGWSDVDKEGLKDFLSFVNEDQYDCYAQESQKKFINLADMQTADTNGNYTREELNEWKDMVDEKCIEY